MKRQERYAKSAVVSAKDALAAAKRRSRKFTWLRAYIVGRLKGNLYEISLPRWRPYWGTMPSRRHALLLATRTYFRTTGWFKMWVIRGRDQGVNTKYGYRVWPAFVQIPAYKAQAARAVVRAARKRYYRARRARRRAKYKRRRFARKYCRRFNRSLWRLRRQVARARFLKVARNDRTGGKTGAGWRYSCTTRVSRRNGSFTTCRRSRRNARVDCYLWCLQHKESKRDGIACVKRCKCVRSRKTCKPDAAKLPRGIY